MYGAPAPAATPGLQDQARGDGPPRRRSPAGQALCRACRGDQARHCLPLRKRMPLLRSAPVEWRPISRTPGWFEPEKLGGDAMTEKTVRRHSVSRRTMLAGTAGVRGGAALASTAHAQTGAPAAPAASATAPPPSRYGDPAWWARRKEEIIEPALELCDPPHHLWC